MLFKAVHLRHCRCPPTFASLAAKRLQAVQTRASSGETAKISEGWQAFQAKVGSATTRLPPEVKTGLVSVAGIALLAQMLSPQGMLFFYALRLHHGVDAECCFQQVSLRLPLCWKLTQ